MQKNENIVRYTAAELDEKLARGEDMTDWAYVDSLTEEELEASIDWDDEGEFDLSRAYPYRFPPIMRTLTVCFDEAIVAWFKARDGDYLARMRFVLRDYADAQALKLASERSSRRRRAG